MEESGHILEDTNIEVQINLENYLIVGVRVEQHSTIFLH